MSTLTLARISIPTLALTVSLTFALALAFTLALAPALAPPPPSASASSAGVIAYIMLGGYSPFQSKVEGDRDELFRKIKKGKFKYHREHWKDVSTDAKDLISQMLTRRPDDRPSAQVRVGGTCGWHMWVVRVGGACGCMDRAAHGCARMHTHRNM